MKQVFALIIIICFLLPFQPAPAVNGQAHYISEAKEQSTYHSYASMTTELTGLAESHSDIVSMFSIGTTYEGRKLWVIKLSDNPDIDESDEPDVLYMGAHHGNEKPSYEVLIYFINYVTEKYYENSNEGSRVRYVVNNRELYIVPMVNPDGVEANKRKSQEPNYGPLGNPLPDIGIGDPVGVDLNRNYDYMWGMVYPADSANPYSNTYQGESAFCELETQAVRDFVGSHDFVLSLSYHTYSELILYPWGYTPQPTDDDELFRGIANGISAINDYEVMQASELYMTSGDACDWLYGEKVSLAFTIELGKEHSPPIEEVLNISKTHVLVNLYIAEIADNPGGEWVIREEKAKEDKGSIFDDTLGSFAAMSAMMMIMFGVVWGGLAKCISIAVKSEKMKVKHGKMEK
ncbi:MAG: zinc carboxypeptidase [Candidatus Thermoplasmatota archaeon]|nr:zinc carboxypeptidase [Candidatus Thermoplasmatota archaeon]